MTRYVVVQLQPTDEDVIKRYFEVGGAAVKKHGGMAIAGGPGNEVIEDNGGGHPPKVLLSFPNEDAVRAWMNDPELVEVHALRRDGADTTMTLLDAR